MKLKTVISILLGLLLFMTGVACNRTTSEKPLEVISVITIVEPGSQPPHQPVVEIVLKNVADEPVISLNATIETAIGSANYKFSVTPTNPLKPGETVADKESLFGGYRSPLKITGKLQGGKSFSYEVELSYTNR